MRIQKHIYTLTRSQRRIPPAQCVCVCVCVCTVNTLYNMMVCNNASSATAQREPKRMRASTGSRSRSFGHSNQKIYIAIQYYYNKNINISIDRAGRQPQHRERALERLTILYIVQRCVALYLHPIPPCIPHAIVVDLRAHYQNAHFMRHARARVRLGNTAQRIVIGLSIAIIITNANTCKGNASVRQFAAIRRRVFPLNGWNGWRCCASFEHEHKHPHTVQTSTRLCAFGLPACLPGLMMV